MCKYYEEGDRCKAYPDGLKDEDFKLWEDKEIECSNGIFFEPINQNVLNE